MSVLQAVRCSSYSATGSCQSYTVPITGPYQVTVAGAQGGESGATDTGGGLGAVMQGDFKLTAGEVLQLVVGTHPTPKASDDGAGGGGGTFVFASSSCTSLPAEPLIVAGGGGGGVNGGGGLTGAAGGSAVTAGGTGGNGGQGDNFNPDAGAIGYGGAGGAGWLSAGTNGGYDGISVGGGQWTGGTGIYFPGPDQEGSNGGFGGGGGGGQSFGGGQQGSGGGGGYSGGGASDICGGMTNPGGQGCNPPAQPIGGGGGGSYNSGYSQVNTAASNSGAGYVHITFIGVDCGGTYVDINTDSNNCDGCGKACPTAEICSDAACGCAVAAQTYCPSASECTDLTSDPANCSACGFACPTGQICTNSTCGCPTGETYCSAESICANVETDSNNCGACGSPCGTGQQCTNGKCTLICPTGSANCDGVFSEGCNVNTTNDSQNCSACGNVCGAGATCENSTCTCSLSGYTYCDAQSECTDLQVDEDNCGTCGNSCLAGESCLNGVCGCPSGSTYCSTTAECASLTTDTYNCGTCGNYCAAGAHVTQTACVNGDCENSGCGQGYADCDQEFSDGCETNLQNSADNCGACHTACGYTDGGAQGVCCWQPGEQTPCYYPGTDCSTLTECPVGTPKAGMWAACPSGGVYACSGVAAGDCVCWSDECCDYFGGVYCANIPGGGCFPAGTNCSAQTTCPNTGNEVFACDTGYTYSCAAQACVCDTQSCCTANYPGTTYCLGVGCPDLQTDPNNCGSCGNVCPAGGACLGGKCAPPCPGNALQCPGTITMCNELGGSHECGLPPASDCYIGGKGAAPYTCPNPEPTPPVCLTNVTQDANGDCICDSANLTTPGIESLANFCGGNCVDLLNDASNCGECGFVCPSPPPGATEHCSDAKCYWGFNISQP